AAMLAGDDQPVEVAAPTVPTGDDRADRVAVDLSDEEKAARRREQSAQVGLLVEDGPTGVGRGVPQCEHAVDIVGCCLRDRDAHERALTAEWRPKAASHSCPS